MMEARETMIDSEAAENALKNIPIPPCPGVIISLMEEIRQPEVDFNKIAKLIGGDVGLAASMLKMANSPFFALKNKVNSVQLAISVLGLKNIAQIIRGVALRQSVGQGISMDRFWDRSNFTAVVASRIAAGIPGFSREDAYTFGLFHDCGIPVLMQKFPDYKQRLSEANRAADLAIVIEEQHYSTNHAIVGSMLARNWLLPENVSKAILVHHDHSIFSDRRLDASICTLVAITLIAEHIVASFLDMPDDAEWLVDGKSALEFLGYSDDELDEIAEDSLSELSEIHAYRG